MDLPKENVIVNSKNILICFDDELDELDESLRRQLDDLRRHFCGYVVTDLNELMATTIGVDSMVYLCGDLLTKTSFHRAKVIRQLSYHLEISLDNYQLIDIGQVPLNLHGVAVFFRRFFDPSRDYYTQLEQAHPFGIPIHLTPVENGAHGLKFRLLRCSSSLNCLTDNFRQVDYDVVGQVNQAQQELYQQTVQLNHVLAQVCDDTVVIHGQGHGPQVLRRKPRTRSHSAKTRDMPKNGLIAFCSFYHGSCASDPYDRVINDISLYPQLRFKLKPGQSYPGLQKRFEVTLYPHSLLIMSLLTNRLYTHEIVPSPLPIEHLPIRFSYIIRCSKTEAIFRHNFTYIDYPERYVRLKEPTDTDTRELQSTSTTTKIPPPNPSTMVAITNSTSA